MGSQTSPGKKGSVQPISEYQVGAFRVFLASECTRVGPGGSSHVSSAWGECVLPVQSVGRGEPI